MPPLGSCGALRRVQHVLSEALRRAAVCKNATVSLPRLGSAHIGSNTWGSPELARSVILEDTDFKETCISTNTSNFLSKVYISARESPSQWHFGVISGVQFVGNLVVHMLGMYLVCMRVRLLVLLCLFVYSSMHLCLHVCASDRTLAPARKPCIERSKSKRFTYKF